MHKAHTLCALSWNFTSSKNIWVVEPCHDRAWAWPTRLRSCALCKRNRVQHGAYAMRFTRGKQLKLRCRVRWTRGHTEKQLVLIYYLRAQLAIISTRLYAMPVLALHELSKCDQSVICISLGTACEQQVTRCSMGTLRPASDSKPRLGRARARPPSLLLLQRRGSATTCVQDSTA